MSKPHCQRCPWVPRALSMELSGRNYLPALWLSCSPGFQPAIALPPHTLLTPGTHSAMLQRPSCAHVCQSPGPLVICLCIPGTWASAPPRGGALSVPSGGNSTAWQSEQQLGMVTRGLSSRPVSLTSQSHNEKNE